MPLELSKRKLVLATAYAAMGAMTATTAAAAEFTAKDLAAEEAKFAAYSVQHGMRDAFVEFFADDSVLLRPDPVDGRPFMRARTNPPIVLNWKSQLTVLSASKDFGLSTGPSSVSAKNDATSYGEFFSVWQKQKNGEWRVLFDHGISHGEQQGADVPLIAHDLPVSKTTSTAAGDDGELRFIDRTREVGASRAYAETLRASTRLLRNDVLPITGPAAINAYLKTVDGTWTWATLRKGASAANDFVYVLGAYTWQPPTGGEQAKQRGYFIRVWIREGAAEASRWTLAGEVLTPRPPSKN